MQVDDPLKTAVDPRPSLALTRAATTEALEIPILGSSKNSSNWIRNI